MSDASQSAHVRITIADYAVADPLGKVTMVGAGIGIAGVNPATGMTAPFTVIAVVSFDPKFIGDNPAVELSLETNEGQLVQLPGQRGPMREGTSEKLNPPVLPGANVPKMQSGLKPKSFCSFRTDYHYLPGVGTSGE